MINSLEIEEIIKRNREKQNEFLSGERKQYLEELFRKRGSGGKLKIEIGIQELKIIKKTKRKTSTGVDILDISFYKPPSSSSFRNTKDSYSTIDCYHTLNGYGGDFENEWFKHSTKCFSEEDFAHINKGDVFLCLVKHVEKLFEKYGKIVTYEKGNRFGQDIVIVEPQIIKVYPIGTEDIKIDYFKLYEPLNK